MKCHAMIHEVQIQKVRKKQIKKIIYYSKRYNSPGRRVWVAIPLFLIY